MLWRRRAWTPTSGTWPSRPTSWKLMTRMRMMRKTHNLKVGCSSDKILGAKWHLYCFVPSALVSYPSTVTSAIVLIVIWNAFRPPPHINPTSFFVPDLEARNKSNCLNYVLGSYTRKVLDLLSNAFFSTNDIKYAHTFQPIYKWKEVPRQLTVKTFESKLIWWPDGQTNFSIKVVSPLISIKSNTEAKL